MNANAPSSELIVERYVRARRGEDSTEFTRPLDHYRDIAAWVLLGDPGAGKTTVFESRSKAENGYYISARDFLELELKPNWHAPLFIDALDEMRAGTADGRTVLGQIRSKLQQLGTPKFRISCREADWLGNSDSQALKALFGEDQFLELHLEPLTPGQIKALVMAWQGSNEVDAESFVREAAHRSLDGLLDNPQTLRMLTAATTQGWPDSKTKTETYAKACEKLVQEHSAEWQDATRNTALPADQLLQAASFLFAIVLLANKSAITYDNSGALPAHVITLRDIPIDKNTPDAAVLRAAIKTRLFRSDGAGGFMPVHRTVAEYLGAKHLASRIREGLPAQRVLALMTGEDGGVVPELRGLHAWLAAHVQGALREELIARDPLGVTLYGDVRSFNRNEKLKVLDALRDEATHFTYFRNEDWTSTPFGALATSDMTDDFKVLLQSPDRSPPHQALLDCVLDAMAHGSAMPPLTDTLESIVRDASYWRPGLRKKALKILVKTEDSSSRLVEDHIPRLKQLLEEISNHVIEDSEDELLGTLLAALYPTHLSAKEIWKYFKQPKSDHLLGSYWLFWHYFVEKHAPAVQLPELIDALIDSGFQLSHSRDRLDMANVVGGLLVKGLARYGTGIAIDRLYRWLSLGLAPRGYCPLSQEHKSALGKWFEEHVDIYQAVFAHGLSLPKASLWQVNKRLYAAKPPPNFGPWCLRQAGNIANTELRQSLVGEAIHLTHKEENPNKTIELIQRWAAQHPSDAAWCDQWLVNDYPRADAEHFEWERNHNKKLEEERAEQLAFFAKTLPSFSEDLAHLGALSEVADAYLGYFEHREGNTPQARLLTLLDQNETWVRLALHGLRQCLFRDDLPAVKDIINLDLKGQRYTLAMPSMAAMALRHAEDATSMLNLPEKILETVIAFRLIHPYDETPAWFTQLVVSKPEVVASVLQQVITAQLATKKENVVSLYQLAHDPAYAPVAKRIVIDLLQAFPLKARKQQLGSLRFLILALMANVDAQSQLKLIADKASQATDVAQHVYWLTASMQLAPDLYLAPTREYVGHSQARTSHLTEFIREQSEISKRVTDLPIQTLAFLIELLGPRCNPSWTGRSGRVTPEIEMGRYVQNLISLLGAKPDDAAHQALTSLLKQKGLQPWEDILHQALYTQRVTRRKALFKPATVAQVCATLANLTPANAADLWALTVDHLRQLASEIRNGSTNDYRQYWAGELPKIEDDCRDALLSDLKKHLTPMGIGAEREGHYADAKRADIKVIAMPNHIPVEIKRETHPDVWKAIREQLVARYGRESASDGYGIYLVFWFTGNMKAAPTDGGAKVKTPQELQRRLAATVPEALKHKIAVLVVDCSKPQATQSTKKISL